MRLKTTQQTPESNWQARWTAIRSAPRAVVLGIVVLLVFGGFTQRLRYLQFVQGEHYRELASWQSTRLVRVLAARGIIYDRNGVPLVHNIPSFDVAVTTAYLPEEEQDARAVLSRLSELLGVSDEDALYESLDTVPFAARYQSLVVEKGVERQTALVVAQEAVNLPGVSVLAEAQRSYDHGPLVSQLLGYLLPIPEGGEEEYIALGYDPATDRVGFAGVEATFEEALRGQKGERLIEEDVLGREIRVLEERAIPLPGSNVYLTLDVELQQVVEDALRQGMERPSVNSPRGAAIVMNPQTGEVLAMVSLPTYDNNLFARGISARDWNRLSEDIHRPLLNHGISDNLPPGSVFKIVVAAGALQEKVLDEQRTHLTCPGTIVVPNKYFPNDPGQAQPFRCWRNEGHGALDVVGGLAFSCDIFFYKTGGGFEETEFEGLGVDGIAQYAKLFGMGEPTGVELPAESGALVPSATWKRLSVGESWSTGDTYNVSIGQGYVEVTPLQMLNAVNVVANKGTLFRPRVVHHVADPQADEWQSFQPEIIRTLPISAETWSLVQQGMEGAVAYGTAVGAQIEGVRVAGKTGTAQFCDDIMCGVGYQQPEHAWFAAFAPVDSPEVSVIVFIYNGGEGSQTSVPVAHEILEYYFRSDETSP